MKNEVLDYKAYAVSSGSVSYLYVRDPSDDATRAALHDAFAPYVMPDGPLAHLWTHDEIVAAGGDPAAAFAVEAAPGFGLMAGFDGEVVKPSKQKGTHGYDPKLPVMRASLIFYGPPVVAGRLSDARLIDIAPTVAGWLSLDMKDVDGHALPVKLRGQ